MKSKLLLLMLALISAAAYSQEKFTRYYNSGWSPSSKADADYYIDFVRKDTLYHTTAYFLKSNKIQGRSVYADTALNKPRGLLVRYSEEGILLDSGFHFMNGNLMYRYHYAYTGKLDALYKGNERGEQLEVKGYDESGNQIKNFIYEKEAEFPGGPPAWIRFVSNNIKTKVPVKNGAAEGTYNVIIRFIVDKNGQVADAKPETNLGYGMEEEALRVIRKSPKWNNAIQFNRPVNAYRRQPITFVVQK